MTREKYGVVVPYRENFAISPCTYFFFTHSHTFTLYSSFSITRLLTRGYCFYFHSEIQRRCTSVWLWTVEFRIILCTETVCPAFLLRPNNYLDPPFLPTFVPKLNPSLTAGLRIIITTTIRQLRYLFGCRW